ncbi:MAG: DUF433 domain-containing protein [Candidatus Competibacteraceae bacterium]|jgi:uncharacterized protein (DUF433 family)|nr:DUF433 domain-containing protein [Candidatus Competibacteraceae bacterium]
MSTEVVDQHIVTKPGIAGGKPHIIGHRITVQNIVIWHERMGKSADEISAEYDLKLSEVYAALAYYFDHREEVDRDIEESEEFVASLRKTTPSILQKKLASMRRE